VEAGEVFVMRAVLMNQAGHNPVMKHAPVFFSFMIKDSSLQPINPFVMADQGSAVPWGPGKRFGGVPVQAGQTRPV